MTQALAVNGLVMPTDFPSAPFEVAYSRVVTLAGRHPANVEHFMAAWNAISLRFLALISDGDEFTASIGRTGSTASLEERYSQERHLFGFFSNVFSSFEAYFYGMFAVGAMLNAAAFPLTTPREQQAVAPGSTERAYSTAFSTDPLLTAFQAVFADPAYRELREVRNILTHRTAPGRRIFVSIESDEDLSPEWKINNIVLDGATTAARRAHTARILGVLLDAAAKFAQARIT
jgi:hypothetical protein